MSTVIQLRGDAWRRIESGTWLAKIATYHTLHTYIQNIV